MQRDPNDKPWAAPDLTDDERIEAMYRVPVEIEGIPYVMPGLVTEQRVREALAAARRDAIHTGIKFGRNWGKG